VRAFLIESVLPFFGVCGLVFGLTFGLFEVPNGPPAAVSMEARVDPARSAPEEGAARLPPEAPPAREQLNDVLARAVRQLNAGRMARPSEGAAIGAIAPPGITNGIVAAGAAPRAETPADPGLLQTVSALGEAVKAVHDARTEEDILRAEARMRGAREQMEATCKAGGAGAPLCEGAAQIRSLGY
jgi:hypothetical protein